MRLLLKFNLVLICVFALGLLAVCLVTNQQLKESAREQVLENAKLMMETAVGIRGYTTRQIKPLLAKQLESKFLPQSVPAFAATESFNELRKKYPDYTYKEATLNPTNLRDRAVDWEADLISKFSNSPKVETIANTRQTPSGEVLT